VSEELSETDNLWLNSLRNDLTIAQLERFTKVPERDLPLDVYMHVIGEANAEEMEEMFMRKKNGVIFTEKIDAFLKEKYGPEYIARGIVIGKAEGMAKGIAEGMAEGKAEMLLNVLRAKFKKVPKETEKIILAMTDSIALDSWGVHAATCSTMQEFSAAIK
jgi:flagellar biosynthesis/type III secretory pathway protein FliH